MKTNLKQDKIILDIINIKKKKISGKDPEATNLGEISANHFWYLYSHVEDISRFNTKHQTVKLASEHETGPK